MRAGLDLPPPSADAVAIGRLLLRGGMAAAAARRPNIEAALASLDWPEPDPGAYVIVDRLRVRGIPDGRTAAQARELIQGAVHGRDHESERARAVRFDSLADMLACLLEDLVRGRASRRWFWRAWGDVVRQPPGEAAATVLARHPLHAATVTAVLAGRGLLAPVWRTLSAADGVVILRAVTAAIGRAALADAPIEGEEVTSGEPDLSGDLRADVRAGPAAALLARWRPAVARLTPADPRVRLAALLATLESGVALADGRTAAARVATLAEMLAGTSHTEDRPTVLPAQVAEPDTTPFAGDRPEPAEPMGEGVEGSAERRELPLGSPAASPWPEQPDTAASEDRPQRPAQPAESDIARPIGGRSTSRPTSLEPSVSAGVAPPAAAEDRSPELAFVSRWSGAFYLVNALARLDAARRLTVLGDPPEGGWTLLLGLATRLGLPEDDALALFLRERVAEAALWAGADVDWNAEALRFDGAARALYGDDVWAPALIAVPGRTEATSTHIDVYLPMSAVRADVRSAALDVNPGWVPWLGRVVAFHYRERLELPELLS